MNTKFLEMYNHCSNSLFYTVSLPIANFVNHRIPNPLLNDMLTVFYGPSFQWHGNFNIYFKWQLENPK